MDQRRRVEFRLCFLAVLFLFACLQFDVAVLNVSGFRCHSGETPVSKQRFVHVLISLRLSSHLLSRKHGTLIQCWVNVGSR